tara:strand:+ start:2095 stop:3450 length:1356 start_codon:yes stop_codon:yes gene_type:complete
METTIGYKYLRLIPNPNFNLWDVKRYRKSSSLSFENVVRLSDILTPYKNNVSKEEMIKNDWQIIKKINFGGELFLRDKEEINTYKGKLNLVPENALIYSKINVRHGCIYFNEKGSKPFGVSTEYPTFLFDETKINGFFLKKVLRSEEFKKLLNTKTSGISKARVKQNEFLNIEIPLPSLTEQDIIIKAYQEEIKKAKKQEKQAQGLEEEIEKYLFDELGYEYEEETTKTKYGQFIKLIKYSNFNKWGVNKNDTSNLKMSDKFNVKSVSDLCTVSSGGTPSRTRKDYYNGDIPWIKTGEVVNDIIYDTEEKITSEAIKNSSAKIYPKDSLIIAMYGQGLTRGRTAKLGIDSSTNQACAVLFNIDNEIILTDYFWVYLMNEYDRLRALASGNNQPNLNAQMIKNYKVVIPPLDKQAEIVSDYFNYKQKAKKHRTNSISLIQKAETEFEKAIFS